MISDQSPRGASCAETMATAPADAATLAADGAMPEGIIGHAGNAAGARLSRGRRGNAGIKPDLGYSYWT